MKKADVSEVLNRINTVGEILQEKVDEMIVYEDQRGCMDNISDLTQVLLDEIEILKQLICG